MIPKEIINNHCLKKYINEWLIGEIDLPNRKIIHLFKEYGDFVFNTTIQNYDNYKVIDCLLEKVDIIITKNKLNYSQLNKITLLNIEDFTHLIVAPFDYTVIPNSNFPEFDKRRMYFYPIYDFELTGKESKKDIKSITRKVLSTTEWNREPAPLVRYKFTNPKHQYGTIGKSLVIDKEENVYNALGNFETNDCLMEVQNSLKEKLLITFFKEDSKYKVIGKDDLYIDFKELEKKLKTFFRRK